MSKPRSLLFIFTDEQRADTLGCYGNPLGATPATDALASSGAVFENAYCTSPVCTPSRGSIMAGLYPHAHGALWNNRPLDRGCRTIAELVPPSYRRGYIGKWHLGDEVIAQHGFEHWVSIEDQYRTYCTRPEDRTIPSDYYRHLVAHGVEPDAMSQGAPLISRRKAANLPEPMTKAAFVGDRTAQFIRDCKDQPFVLYANFLEPHMPFTGPLNGLFAPETLPVGPAFFRTPDANTSQRVRTLAEKYRSGGFEGVNLTTEAGWRTIRARYMGLVAMVDHAVARILWALEEAGRADDTIVVFTSDHGDMMGDHAIIAKGVMYEEATRVPLIIRAPGAAAGRRVPGRVSLVDLVPTLLDLMGVDAPDGLHGVSRRNVLEGKGDLADNDVFIQWNAPPPPEKDEYGFVTAPWRTVIHRGWKLNLCPSDRGELYDLNSDPHELTNRFDEPGQRERIARMTRLLREQAERFGDSAEIGSAVSGSAPA